MLEYTKELYKQSNIIDDTLIITLNRYKNEIKKIITKSQKIIYEPQKKGTLYQILNILTYKDIKLNDILVITPSDHYFSNKNNLYSQLKIAIDMQKDKENIILFGQKINNNINLNYGWIQTKNNINIENINIGNIIKFKEKPSKEIQEKMLTENSFYNMGIFIGKVKTFYDIIQLQNYTEYKQLLNLRYGINNIKNLYKTLDEKSFDKEILEKIQKRYDDRLLMISTDFGWDDIGIYENLKKVKNKVQIQNV